MPYALSGSEEKGKTTEKKKRERERAVTEKAFLCRCRPLNPFKGTTDRHGLINSPLSAGRAGLNDRSRMVRGQAAKMPSSHLRRGPGVDLASEVVVIAAFT